MQVLEALALVARNALRRAQLFAEAESARRRNEGLLRIINTASDVTYVTASSLLRHSPASLACGSGTQVSSCTETTEMVVWLTMTLTTLPQVSSCTETTEVIEQIIKVGYEVLNADRVSMFLVDLDKKELVSTVSKDAKGFRIPMNKGIAGSVATTMKDVNIEDVYHDDRFDQVSYATSLPRHCHDDRFDQVSKRCSRPTRLSTAVPHDFQLPSHTTTLPSRTTTPSPPPRAERCRLAPAASR